MAQKLTTAVEIELFLKGQEGVKSLKEQLKDATRAAQLLAEKFGETSPQAQGAIKRVAELRDQIEDLNNRVKALNPDKFQRFATFASGIASGFSAAQGAMALFGAESEDVQKQLARVQGAMAFAQGLQGIKDLTQSFSGLGNTIKTTVVNAFSSLKGAIAASGIGLLAVGIAVVIERFTAMQSAAEKAAEASEKALEATQQREQTILQLELADIEREKNLQVSRVKAREGTEEEIFDIEQKFRKKRADALKVYRDALQQDTKEYLTANKQYLDAIAAIEIADNERQAKINEDQKQRQQERIVSIKRDDELIGTVRQQGYDKLEAQQKEFEFKRLTLFDESATERLNREAEEYERSLKQQQDASNARISLANATASALMSINDIMAKSGAEATNFAKAITLLQIGIDTASAISSLNAESAKVAARMAAVTGPATPVFTAAYYAQGIARILANVAQAKKVLSGGGAGVNAPVASTMQAPQAREFTAFGLPSDRVEQAGGAGAMRVYVVDSDITRQQKRSRAIQRTSVI